MDYIWSEIEPCKDQHPQQDVYHPDGHLKEVDPDEVAVITIAGYLFGEGSYVDHPSPHNQNL